MNPHSSDPWIGRLIGERQRYRLDTRVGAGGMGDVFLAMDTLLGQQVALKLIKDTLVASEELRKRFEREVKVCAALKSEHIVEVSDYGITPEGYPFYVMEYLRGQSLGQLLRLQKRLNVSRTVSIISQICEGLHHAHQGVYLWQRGATVDERVQVVHRDLKPDNIFLVPTTLGELVKILDFGVAKIRNETAEQTNLTSMFIGTFHYAAPEQLGVEKDLDGRADIYSLGIIIYEMLSGTDPFGLGFNTNTNNISGASWVLAHTSKSPVPLRAQPGLEQLSWELEAVVMRCLQKAPGDRFASVDELKQALQAVAVEAGASGAFDGNAKSLAAGAVPYSSSTESSESPLGIRGEKRGPPHVTGSGASSDGLPQQAQKTAAALQSSNLKSEIVSKPVDTSSNFLSQPKSPLLFIGSGITILALVVGGIYYLPQLSNQLIVKEAKPIVKEAKPIVKAPFSLANTITGHSDSVWSVLISPNGHLASGSEDRTIKIWRLDTGEFLRTIAGHSDTVRAIAISPNGQILASGSGDKTIKIWRLSTGEWLRNLSGHSDLVWSLAISPDGQTLVSGSNDGTVNLWRLSTGELLRTITGHSDIVYSVALSPDGQTIATGSKDKTIKIWDLSTGKLLRILSGHSDTVRAVAISPDGQTIASGSWDKTIKIWDLHTGELLHNFSGHTSRVIAIAISPEGQNIVSSSQDKTIKIWHLGTGELLQTLSGHSDWVLSVTISPNAQTIVSGSKDQTIKIWRR